MPTEIPDATQDEHAKILHAKLEWEQTFDAVPDMIFITDTNYNIVRANRAMAERCGVTPAELVGRKCFEIMHGTRSAPVDCPHAGLLESGETQTSEFTVYKLHDTIQESISPIMDANGRIKASVHVARDVTEKRHREKLLAAQQKQLEEINSSLETRIAEAVTELRKKDDILIQQSRLNAMGEMINLIAHQWRQPLNNIGLIVQNLQLAFRANDLTEQDLAEDVADTMNVLQQISDTIDDFRNFFSYEEKEISFVINEVLSRSLALIEPSLKRKGISMQFEEEPEVKAVGCPNEYMQAFLNIMLNARDALIDNHVVKPQISIRVFRENGHSVLTVCNNGGTIPESVLPKIYDPYFTTKQQSKAAGIGLYMAKMVVEKKMHGTLSARNVDDGVEFRIEI